MQKRAEEEETVIKMYLQKNGIFDECEFDNPEEAYEWSLGRGGSYHVIIDGGRAEEGVWGEYWVSGPRTINLNSPWNDEPYFVDKNWCIAEIKRVSRVRRQLNAH